MSVSAGAVLQAAWNDLKGTMGEMALALTVRRPVSAVQVRAWVTRLRSAADKLEELL